MRLYIDGDYDINEALIIEDIKKLTFYLEDDFQYPESATEEQIEGILRNKEISIGQINKILRAIKIKHTNDLTKEEHIGYKKYMREEIEKLKLFTPFYREYNLQEKEK